MNSCGCHGGLPCKCCAGVDSVTPESEFNQPGLSSLHYRAGTHATFFETMQADLSKDRRLDLLTTREGSDASMAMLDAWALVGDVLTFYQERIANEGFLATATERRSVAELAATVGYRPRPGVSASAFLAYTLDSGATTEIPADSIARSVPGPGETQQAFETATALPAKAAWNNLQVRLTRPHTKKSILGAQKVYLKGLVATLKKGDPLFVEFAPGDAFLCRILDVVTDTMNARTEVALEDWADQNRFQVGSGSSQAVANQLRALQRVEEFGLRLSNSTVKGILPIIQDIVSRSDAETLSDAQLTQKQAEIEAFSVAHPPRSGSRAAQWLRQVLRAQGVPSREGAPPLPTVGDIASKAGLQLLPSLAPGSTFHRSADLQTAFDGHKTEGDELIPHISGAALSTLIAFQPALGASLATALANAAITPESNIRVYAVTRTVPFGQGAAPMARTTRDPANEEFFITTWSEWPLELSVDGDGNKAIPNQIHLEKEFDTLTSKPLVAIQQGTAKYVIPDRPGVATVSRVAYGLGGKVTRLTFAADVLENVAGANLGLLREVKVFIAAEMLPLAEQPIPYPVCGSDAIIELNSFYDGLTPGRWIIVSAERADTPGTSGVQASELMLIGDVQHRAVLTLAGDRMHTFITPAVPSNYCYKRDTVKIYGNVVKATNGETRKEILGGGDAAASFQEFPLKQPPLTFVSAPTADGVKSSLRVYVNDVEWHEADSPVGLSANERRFFTQTSDAGETKVIFGNGVNGSRVPTGNTNVRAAYRNGIGKGGNVGAGQLSLLGSKPNGVKEVINPLRASGGADKDTRDQIRMNAPLSVTALDRLVSVQDYAHFARTFAGVGKASAAALTDGGRRLVHLTIAGIDDIPIDPSSDLYRNVRRAIRLYGDSNQPLELAVRTAKFLVIQGEVKLDPDYPWEATAPNLTAALLEKFSFDRRELGQHAFLSEVIDTLQRVPGVRYVDVDKFGAVSEEELTPAGISHAIAGLLRADIVPAGMALADAAGGIKPAEIAYFHPSVLAAIALNQIEDAS